MLKNIAVCFLAVVGLSTCSIKEDMSQCPGTILLDYTAYSQEVIDDIAPDEQVSVYIFDKDDVCCDIFTYTYGDLEAMDFEFKVPIQYNGLNAVVWHGNNSNDYYNPNMVKGEKYQDFYVKVNQEVAKAVFTHVPSPLWASPLEPIDYCAKITRHRIHMTRLHTRVNVNLRRQQNDGSVKEVNMDEYLVRILAPNNIYRTDYSLCGDCELMEFNNAEEIEQNSFIDWAHVGTLRITPDMDCTLQIAPMNNLSNPIYIDGSTKFNLVEYMLKSRDRSSDAELTDQNFLDLNKDWNLDFLLDPIKDVALSVTIQGWTVWFHDVNLD